MSEKCCQFFSQIVYHDQLAIYWLIGTKLINDQDCVKKQEDYLQNDKVGISQLILDKCFPP